MNRTTSLAGAAAATFLPRSCANSRAQRDDRAISGARDIAAAVRNLQQPALTGYPSTFQIRLLGGSEELGDFERIELLHSTFRLD